MVPKSKFTLTISIAVGEHEPTIRVKWNLPLDHTAQEKLADKVGIVMAALQLGNLNRNIEDELTDNPDEHFVSELMFKIDMYRKVLMDMGKPEGPIVRPTQALRGRND